MKHNMGLLRKGERVLASRWWSTGMAFITKRGDTENYHIGGLYLRWLVRIHFWDWYWHVVGEEAGNFGLIILARLEMALN